MTYKTCTHVHDNGHYCQSAAVAGRDFCCYHLRHRGRLMRMAQYRARNERFDLRLPPLENMHAVQSALSQILEALAADMIELKRARAMLTVLRQAADNFKHPDAWQPSAYMTDQSQPHPENYDSFEAEYGLPEQLDLNLRPEVAFPPPPVTNNHAGAPPLSPSFGDRVGDAAATDQSSDPYVSAPGIGVGGVPDDFEFRPDFPVTPEYVELDEIRRTQGDDASLARSAQMLRNQRRRQFRSESKRYAEIAARINLHRAAAKLAEQKLAAEKAAAAQMANDEPRATRKPPISAAAGENFAAKEDAIA